jgi:hypothetical protein
MGLELRKFQKEKEELAVCVNEVQKLFRRRFFGRFCSSAFSDG